MLERAAHPTPDDMRQAAPNLHWRRCFDCDHIGLHVDAMLPWVRCSACNSADTRLLRDETHALRNDAR